MEDFNVPTTATTTTTTTISHEEQPTTLQNLWRSDMGSTSNHNTLPVNEPQSVASFIFGSHSQHTLHYLQPHETLQFPRMYRSEYVVPSVFRSFPHVYNVESPLDSEERRLHSLMSKAARSNRKLARQRSVSLKRNSSSSLTPPNRITTGSILPQDTGNNNDQKELYTFCTSDKKKLRVLLKKELRSSDVGTPGRIVLPKRDAEKYLPSLSSKEGIPIVISNVNSNQEWVMRYRFWSNNKGRMYVLDNLGKFVEENRLESGDHMTFYEDENKKLYFSISKAETVAPKPCASVSWISAPITKEALDEEDLSLEILMKEFQHKEEGANSLMTSYMDDVSSFDNYEQVRAIEPSSSSTSTKVEVDEVDNCFGDLGTFLNLSN